MSRALVGRDGWAVALMGDAAAAAAYWAGRERKKFAVDVAAGPRAAPTYYATFYASARSGQGALKAVRDLRQGFSECFRVLEIHGVLVFKWNETQIKLSQVLQLTTHKPLFGNTSGRKAGTHWLVFMKPGEA